MKAPVGMDFTHKIGADTHGKDATEAVTDGLFKFS
jgi:methanogenic corrinoid protein MtbC1